MLDFCRINCGAIKIGSHLMAERGRRQHFHTNIITEHVSERKTKLRIGSNTNRRIDSQRITQRGSV